MSINSVLPKVWNYAQRAIKVYPSAVFGARGQEVMTKAYEGVFTAPGAVKYNIFDAKWWQQLKQGTKAAGLASEKYAETFAGKGFWATAKASVASIPAKIAQGWRVGGKLAAKKGASSVGQFLGSAKGALAGLGKKLPVIGSLLMVGFELPNIFKATKNEGLVSGAVETGKAGARIGGAMLASSAGAAIGTAICPGIGTAIGGLVGWIAGEWAVKKVVGKSYSEKQDEQQQKIQEAIAEQQVQPASQQVAFNGATNPVTTAYAPQLFAFPQQTFNYANPYQNDFMYQARQSKLNVQA